MDAVRDKNSKAVMEEAAQWVVCLSAPDASLQDRRRFLAWLKRSPVHLHEYLRLERTWADLGRVDPALRVSVAELLAGADENVIELHVASPPIAGRKPRRGRFAGALAACLALACAGLFWFEVQFADRYVTGVGEQRTVKLADGSTVVLNTDTKLRVNFSEGVREVRLLRGEALFNVARDASRPFRVLSDRAIAQALGTSFIVRRKAAQTIVTVIEGRVAVARAVQADELQSAAVPQEALRLSAGIRADVADEIIRTTKVANPVAATAWRSGRLIFEGETLAEAVAEFNRYNDVQIVLEDSRLSGERLSGVFDADQPQALVRFLEASGAIEPVQISGETIVLVRQR